jgi:hypothetical protein
MAEADFKAVSIEVRHGDDALLRLRRRQVLDLPDRCGVRAVSVGRA